MEAGTGRSEVKVEPAQKLDYETPEVPIRRRFPASVRYLRQAVIILALGCAAVLYAALARHTPGSMPETGLLTLACLGTIVIAAGGALAWYMLPLAFYVISNTVYIMVGQRIDAARWVETSFDALWPLPRAAVAGAVLWIAYDLFHLGGWPGDVVIGFIANALGAWCYCNVFRRWYLLTRSETGQR